MLKNNKVKTYAKIKKIVCADVIICTIFCYAFTKIYDFTLWSSTKISRRNYYYEDNASHTYILEYETFPDIFNIHDPHIKFLIQYLQHVNLTKYNDTISILQDKIDKKQITKNSNLLHRVWINRLPKNIYNVVLDRAGNLHKILDKFKSNIKYIQNYDNNLHSVAQDIIKTLNGLKSLIDTESEIYDVIRVHDDKKHLQSFQAKMKKWSNLSQKNCKTLEQLQEQIQQLISVYIKVAKSNTQKYKIIQIACFVLLIIISVMNRDMNNLILLTCAYTVMTIVFCIAYVIFYECMKDQNLNNWNANRQNIINIKRALEKILGDLYYSCDISIELIESIKSRYNYEHTKLGLKDDFSTRGVCSYISKEIIQCKHIYSTRCNIMNIYNQLKVSNNDKNLKIIINDIYEYTNRLAASVQYMVNNKKYKKYLTNNAIRYIDQFKEDYQSKLFLHELQNQQKPDILKKYEYAKKSIQKFSPHFSEVFQLENIKNELQAFISHKKSFKKLYDLQIEKYKAELDELEINPDEINI